MNTSIVAAALCSAIALPTIHAAELPYIKISSDQIIRDAKVVAEKSPASEESAIAGSAQDSICGLAAGAWYGQPAPGAGGGTLSPTAFANPAEVNSSGKIAFYSQVLGSTRNQGIFVADSSGVSAIVRGCGGGGGSGNPGTCGDPSPVGGTFSGFFSGTFFAPDINNAGDVLFFADVTGGSAPRGLFLYKAATQSIVKVAAVGDPSPIGGTFAAVGPGSLNNDNMVVFLASPTGTTNSNVFRWNNGVITNIAKIGDPAPGGGTFMLLGTESLGFPDGTNIPVGPVPDVNDLGNIAFRAIVSGGITDRGLIVSIFGNNDWYVKSGDAVPGGGTYFDFQAPSINNLGQIAFFADYHPSPGNSSSGWFAGMPGATPAPGNFRKVLAFFDPLDGGICFGLAFSRNPMQSIDNAGNVIIWTDVQLSGSGAMQERMLINKPDGTFLTIAKLGDPTPLGGTFGTMDAWPSMTSCRGRLGAATPGAPGGILNAQFVFTRCKPGDANGDCIVNVDDLLAVINAWGPCPNCPATFCPADLTGDCTVNVDDLLNVINHWGM